MSDDSRLHILVEAEGTATVYQPHCGLKIEAVTVRKGLQRLRAPRVRRPGERINLVCAGNASKNKGYGLLPEAIRKLNATRNDLRFSIPGIVAHTGFPEAKSILERLPSLGSNVKVSTATLSSEDYIAWLSDADIVMLPYDTYFYRPPTIQPCSMKRFHSVFRLLPHGLRLPQERHRRRPGDWDRRSESGGLGEGR
jgi:glycosyltransferase involved in cell wall biosynthesis